MAGVPYTLTPQGGTSDEYYRSIAAFTERWLAAVAEPLARLVNNFLAFRAGRALAAKTLEQERSFAEGAFEMLALGVLLREHGAEALHMPLAPAWMLARLAEAQDRVPVPAIEQPVKALRGLVQGLMMKDSPAGQAVDMLPSTEGAASVVARLVDWLRAGGQLTQADRMFEWCQYMARLDAQRAEAILARCLLLAEEFAVESEAALGAYTAEVDNFISCARLGCCGRKARWRYDAALITRTRVEYHLGMLGTEILTRAYRERFLTMPRKIVIVPDCLCARSPRVGDEGEPTCQAVRTALGGKCQNCADGCKVRQLTRLGEQQGFEIYILPDDLRGIGLGTCSKLNGVGVVGISCALTNWDAGWQINDAGVPAQGVLLDYAGCKSHWTENGKATNVNINKLLATFKA